MSEQTTHLLFVLAPKDFRDSEYIVPRAFCEQADIDVTTTSSERVSIGRFGYRVQHHKTLEHYRAERFDGIVFVGGNGSLDFMENADAKQLAQAFAEQHKIVAALCAAPRLLVTWGILKDKKCTGWNADGALSALCERYGAHFVDAHVVRDGTFITGSGPVAAEEFALEIVRAL